MKHIQTFESFVNEDVQLNEGLKASLAGLAIIAALLGGNYLNHSAQRGLDSGKTLEISAQHNVLHDKPWARDTYTLELNKSQKEPVVVDAKTKTITVNTSDMNNSELKRAVRDKIQEIDPNGVTQSIKTMRIDGY